MPGYRKHILAGAVAGSAALFAADQFAVLRVDRLTQATLLAVTLTASIFPDIDTPSKGRPFVYGALAVFDVYLIYTKRLLWAALLGLIAILPCLGGHRGWTHTWWAMFLVPLPLLVGPVHFLGWSWQAAAPWYIAAIIGYGSHLVLDEKW